MIVSGRRIDGETAESWGLVSRVSDNVEETVMTMARNIVQAAPLAVKMAKTSMLAARHLPQAEALMIEKLCYSKLLNTDDRREGLEAWRERRLAIFTGR